MESNSTQNSVASSALRCTTGGTPYSSNGFEVNREKSTPPQESLVFCGYQISRFYVAPTASRTSLTQEFADTAWQRYLQMTPEARRQWFFSIAGTTSAALSWTQTGHLRVFYDQVKTLNRDELAKVDIETVREALTSIAKYLREGLPPSILFHFDKVYATVLVVDANIKAWAAQLFYIVDLRKENPNFVKYLPDVRALRDRLVQADGFPDLDMPDSAVLVPGGSCPQRSRHGQLHRSISAAVPDGPLSGSQGRRHG